ISGVKVGRRFTLLSRKPVSLSADTASTATYRQPLPVSAASAPRLVVKPPRQHRCRRRAGLMVLGSHFRNDRKPGPKRWSRHRALKVAEPLGMDSGQWSGRDPGFGGVHRGPQSFEPTSYTRLQDFLYHFHTGLNRKRASASAPRAPQGGARHSPLNVIR